MKPYQLSLYEKSMPDSITWAEKLQAAARAGFDAVELSMDESAQRLRRLEWSAQERLELLRETRESGVHLNTMCLSGHRKYPMGTGDAAVEKRSMEIMEQAIELAYSLGIRIVQLAGYDVYYEEQSTPTTKERFLQNLAKSTQMAAARGVILGLETMENDFMNTVEKAMYYVATINSPYLKVYPDIGNITNATDQVAKDLRTGAGHIAAVHLKETAPGVFRDLKFGDGKVDFAMAIGVLKGMNVRMYNAEFWYDGGEDWQSTLEQARSFLGRYLDE